MANRLASETSPYLLQHRNNPVDWYPWGSEAFERAVELDRPIFLSVGYASCHWCHVMEHESFEDAEVAAMLNAQFVSVKVDREERPDVDEAYMTAIQMMSSRGGWPMSVFLTPNGQPFFGGTYFPKDDRAGVPGFKTVCRHVAAAWATRREDVLAAAGELAAAVTRTLATSPPEPTGEFGPAAFEHVLGQLGAEFDTENGGFGTAPKFPPHTALEFLNSYSLLEASSQEQAEMALAMSLSTLVHLCLGGIRDHVGGGFHRYSTDARWVLPHFEKMLYDNALMVSNLAMAAMICAEFDAQTSDLLNRAAEQTIGWMVSEMRSPDALFYSAMDADSEGEEGRYYVWTEAELRENLGDRAEAFIQAYGVLPHGNFLDEAKGEATGANVLHLREDRELEFAPQLARLRGIRAGRERPRVDDKCLIGWNGLAIDALTVAGYLEEAAITALAILDFERRHGRLPRQVTGGKPAGDAYLEDYAYFTSGLIKLASFTGLVESEGGLPAELPRPAFWDGEVERLTEKMVELFYDEAGGGFFSVSDRHEKLFGASKPVFDQPTPSSNAIAIRCLIAVGDHARAQQSLGSLLGWMERAPHATEALWTTALSEAFERADEPVPAAAPSPAPPQEVTARLSRREIEADAAGWAEGAVVLSVPEGFHVNSATPAARWIVPTQVVVRPLEFTVSYPPASDDRYDGEIEIPFRVKLPEKSRAEEFEVEVSFQACTETECLAPKSLTLSAVALRP